MMFAGKAGMWVLPFSNRQGLFGSDYEYSFRYGFTLLPVKAQSSHVVMVEGYAISSEAKNRQACWEFIRFLLDKPNPRLVPSRRSLAESKEYSDLVGKEAASIGRAALEGALIATPENAVIVQRLLPAFMEAVSQITEGKVGAKEALEAAQKMAEESGN